MLTCISLLGNRNLSISQYELQKRMTAFTSALFGLALQNCVYLFRWTAELVFGFFWGGALYLSYTLIGFPY